MSRRIGRCWRCGPSSRSPAAVEVGGESCTSTPTAYGSPSGWGPEVGRYCRAESAPPTPPCPQLSPISSPSPAVSPTARSPASPSTATPASRRQRWAPPVRRVRRRRGRRPRRRAAPGPEDRSCPSGWLRGRREQLGHVVLAPALNDPTAGQAIHLDPRGRQRSVRRRHAEELAVVRPPARVADGNGVAISDDVIDLGLVVGDGLLELVGHRLPS